MQANVYILFTALHVMQTRYSEENSVCPSICPSVKRVLCDKMVERYRRLISKSTYMRSV